MQIKELLLSLPLLVFVLWIFIAPVPEERIERACSPITWVGNLTTSTTALTRDKHTATAQSWSDKLSYSCEYLIWRLFYQKDYNQAIEDGLITPPDAYLLENPDLGDNPKDGKPKEVEAFERDDVDNVDEETNSNEEESKDTSNEG